MNYYSFAVLVFSICSFLLGAQIFLNRKDEIGLRYFICSILYTFWGFGFSFGISDGMPPIEASYHLRYSNVAATFIPFAWLHFCLVYTNRKAPAWFLWVLYLIPALSLKGLFDLSLIRGVRPVLVFDNYPIPGWLFYLEAVSYFVLVPAAFICLIQHLSKLEKEAKKKFLNFILVSFSGYFGGAFTFFPVFGLDIPQYAVFLLPFYPFGLAYFMTRKGLFDLEGIVQAAHKDKLAALGILTASINHEIRSPLFVMRGAIETGNNADQIKERVLPQIDRITGIVSRLTHFAKKGVEEEAKIEPLDLKEVLANIRPLFQHQLSYQHIEYTQDIPNDLPKVLADRRYLEEILFNLILNACQALRETQNPEIELKAYGPPVLSQRKLGSKIPNRVWNDKTIVIEISDNGPGMTSEALKNIFKPFNTTKQEGTGLGLYITKQLVEKCGGKIEVFSELGCSAKFSVLLKGA